MNVVDAAWFAKIVANPPAAILNLAWEIPWPRNQNSLAWGPERQIMAMSAFCNVLAAATRADVRKVVLTSSVTVVDAYRAAIHYAAAKSFAETCLRAWVDLLPAKRIGIAVRLGAVPLRDSGLGGMADAEVLQLFRSALTSETIGYSVMWPDSYDPKTGKVRS